MKNKSGTHSNLDICSLHFEIFSGDMKFQIGTIINLDSQFYSTQKLKHYQTFTRNNISEYLSKYEKHLVHIGTPANIQNNYRKLSGVWHDITRLLLYREIMRNILCLGKVLQPRKFCRRVLLPTS